MDKIFTWHSAVRSYELDLQGIVNNAVYLHYLDHARVQHLRALEIDWADWHYRGYDLVLIHTELAFRASLVANEEFYVSSRLMREGKLRVVFEQKIFRQADNKLILDSRNTTVCLSTKNRRPCLPDELAIKLFGSTN